MGLNFNESIALISIIAVASLGFIFPKSKIIFYFEFFVLTLLISLYDSLKSDLFFYSHEYDARRISNSIFEKGYEYLGVIFKNAGVSFETFHIIIAVISMLVFAYVIKKESPQPAFCMSMMYGFATFEYAYQLKALTSSAILVYAVHYYFKDIYDKKRILIYFSLVLLASEFHFFAILFLPVVLASIKNQKRIKRIIFVTLVFGMVFFEPLESLARSMIPAFATYNAGLSFKTIVLSIAWHVCGIFIIVLINDRVKKKKERQPYYVLKMPSNDTISLLEYISRGSYSLLIVVPLYYFTNVTSRVIRTWSIFYFIGISFIRNRGGKRIGYETVLKIVMIAYMIFSFFAYYVWFTHDKTFVKSVIDGNMLLRFLFDI